MNTELATNHAVFYDSDRIKNMLAWATHMHTSKCFPSAIKGAEQALMLIQAGFEMGMPPMESINSLAIINGKMTLYGMAVAKRLRQAGWKIAFKDETDTSVTAIIQKDKEEYQYTSTAKELQQLKSRAASFALKDKLKWHALGRLMRFHVPEVTNGVVSYSTEELIDLEPIKTTVKVNGPVEKSFDKLEEPAIIDGDIPRPNKPAEPKEEATVDDMDEEQVEAVQKSFDDVGELNI
jgi:hypothetical protein